MPELSDNFSLVGNQPSPALLHHLSEIKKLQAGISVDLLRSEAVILSLIKDDPGKPVKYYMGRTNLSYRGFFNVLSTLLKSGLISEEVCSEDRRQRLLR